jgi:hypothetical protein
MASTLISLCAPDASQKSKETKNGASGRGATAGQN